VEVKGEGKLFFILEAFEVLGFLNFDFGGIPRIFRESDYLSMNSSKTVPEKLYRYTVALMLAIWLLKGNVDHKFHWPYRYGCII